MIARRHLMNESVPVRVGMVLERLESSDIVQEGICGFSGPDDLIRRFAYLSGGRSCTAAVWFRTRLAALPLS